MDRALKGLFLFRPVRVCRKTDGPYFADGAGGVEARRFIILKAVEHRYGAKVAKARAEAAKVDPEGDPASFWGKESKKMYLKTAIPVSYTDVCVAVCLMRAALLMV